MQEPTVDSVFSSPDISSFEKAFCVYDVDTMRICQIGKHGDVWTIVVDLVPNDVRIMANSSTHELTWLGEPKWIRLISENKDELSDVFDGSLDLDTNGRRWDGAIRCNVPFGYGILYDEEGRKEYEGFMIDGEKICYGTEYYPDIHQIKYDGCFYFDHRFGYGVLYDRKGAIEHKGFWKADRPSFSQFDGVTIDNCTECLDIPADSFHSQSPFSLLSFLHSLKRVVVGDRCFQNTSAFCASGLDALVHMTIGEESFYSPFYSGPEGTFHVVNCPNLVDIEIHYHSFFYYSACVLDRLPSLRTIVFGACCFFKVTHFILSSSGLVHPRW